MLDVNGDNKVTASEFKRFFQLNSIAATDNQIQMLVNRHDKGRKGNIKYSEYGSIFLSKKDRYKM